MKMVEKEEKGAILYMNQEGAWYWLLNKFKSLSSPGTRYGYGRSESSSRFSNGSAGLWSRCSNSASSRGYKLRLISNNPKKRVGLIGYGLEIVENVPIEIHSNPHNERYLQTKGIN